MLKAFEIRLLSIADLPRRKRTSDDCLKDLKRDISNMLAGTNVLAYCLFYVILVILLGFATAKRWGK